jgi:hypothetical protein
MHCHLKLPSNFYLKKTKLEVKLRIAHIKKELKLLKKVGENREEKLI